MAVRCKKSSFSWPFLSCFGCHVSNSSSTKLSTQTTFMPSWCVLTGDTPWQRHPCILCWSTVLPGCSLPWQAIQAHPRWQNTPGPEAIGADFLGVTIMHRPLRHKLHAVDVCVQKVHVVCGFVVQNRCEASATFYLGCTRDKPLSKFKFKKTIQPHDRLLGKKLVDAEVKSILPFPVTSVCVSWLLVSDTSRPKRVELCPLSLWNRFV